MSTLNPVVSLKSKQGELTALQKLQAPDISVTVLIELLNSVKVGSGRLGPQLIATIAHLVSLGHTPWIDTRRLSPTAPLAEQPGGALHYLDTQVENKLAETLGLYAPDLPALIPVVSTTGDSAEIERLRLLLEHHERSVAVLVNPKSGTPAALANQVHQFAEALRIQSGQLDIVVDFEHIARVSPRDIDLAIHIGEQFGQVPQFRSSVILSGSVPKDRTSEATVTRERFEIELWRKVSESLPRTNVRYGDYGVTYPVPPSDTGDARTPNPYFHYTFAEHSLQLLRKVPREDGRIVGDDTLSRAFADLAEELVGRPEFAGGSYSWGDRELVCCRPGGSARAGSPTRWIAMATSHHLAHLARNQPL